VKAPNAFRPSHSKNTDQAVEVVPAQRRRPDRVKMSRLHRSNRAEAVANSADDLPNQECQVVELEQREIRRLQLPSVHHSPNQNAVARQNGGQAKSQMQRQAGQDSLRQRIGSEHLSVSDSAHRRRAAQVNSSNAAQVRHRNLVNR
jgi:hypothetical protein